MSLLRCNIIHSNPYRDGLWLRFSISSSMLHSDISEARGDGVVAVSQRVFSQGSDAQHLLVVDAELAGHGLDGVHSGQEGESELILSNSEVRLGCLCPITSQY